MKCYGASVQLPKSLGRILWILGYAQKHGFISARIAKDNYGIPYRTYMRDIGRLRAAGYILIFETYLGIRYGGFDPEFAEKVRVLAA